jgi:hypothetical protein
MTRRRLTTLLTTAVAGLLALAPAAHAQSGVKAGSITKTSGTVSATLSWKAGEYSVTAPRLAVSRAGTVVSDLSLADVCRSCMLFADSPTSDDFSSLKVADVDGDGEPEVIVDTFSGGAHCCTTARIYSFRAATGTYQRVKSYNFGNGGYLLKDLDGKGRLLFSADDDAFAYAFASYAASARPPLILSFSTATGRFTNVTRAFPAIIRRDAAYLLKEIRKAKAAPDHEIQGAIAGYVADQYLLGKGSVGKAELARARKRRLTALGFEANLLKFLKATGYR